MSFVRTLVLALVAIGMGAYLWLVEAPKMEQEAKADLLLDIDPAAVERVKLSYPDSTSIEAVKEGGKWRLTAPVAYPADSSVVENFLTTVKETKIERRLAKSEAGELKSYGLDTDTGAQARLEITLAGGKPAPAVVLGVTTPVGYQAFARREGSDEVYVIPLLLQSSAKKSPDELRAKTMFEAGSEGVKHVVIEKPSQKIELQKKGDEAWAMLSPVADTADAESVRSMLDSMSTIDAVAFFDGDKADRKAFGLETGTRFSAEREDGSTVGFTIGNAATDQPAGNYFERASDKQVVKVPDWVATKFAPAADELRDKRLLSCKLEEIRSLAFTFVGDSYTISRGGPGQPWKIEPEVADQKLNQRIVDNAVNMLVLARADAVVGDASTDAELAKFGLDHPAATLEVKGANGTCGSLAGAPGPVPPADPSSPRPPMRQYFLNAAGRTAVLRASEHEYSRIAMKRAAFVDSTQQPAAAAAPAASDEAAAPADGAGSAGKPANNTKSLGEIIGEGRTPPQH